MTPTEIRIERLKEHFNVKKDAELAKKLNINPSTIANWKRRDSMDIDIILQKIEGIDLNWLLKGEETKNKKVQILEDQIVNYEAELKKIDDRIDELTASPVHSEVYSNPDDDNTIKELARIQEENELLKQVVANLSAIIAKK